MIELAGVSKRYEGRATVVALDRRQFVTTLAALPFLQRRPSNDTRLRVASLDWALAETMIALGHDPIAIAAAADWNR